MTEQKRSGCLETGSGLAGFALVVVLMLGASFQASAQPCLPGLVDDSATPTAAPFRGGVVYVDASGSMDGFVAPKNDAAFVNLLYSLKGAFEALVPTVDYFRFGSKIEKINDHEFLEARKKAFFHTSINGLSRISDAVHEINKAPSDRVGRQSKCSERSTARRDGNGIAKRPFGWNSRAACSFRWCFDGSGDHNF